MRNYITLFRYEWKKLWHHISVPIMLLIGCLFLSVSTAFLYMGNGYAYLYHAEDHSVERVFAPYLKIEQEGKEYLKTLSGRIFDADLMEQLSQNYSDSVLGSKQWNLNEYAPFLYLNTLEDHDSASIEDYYSNAGTLEYLKNNNATEEELSYWDKQLTKRTPIVLDYCGGWLSIIRHSDILSLLTILIVGIGLCPSFSEEHKNQTDQLLLSSKNGKRPLFLVKLLASICYAIIVPLILYGVQLLISATLFGLNGFFAPLQLWSEGGDLWNYSVGQFSLMLTGILLLASIMLASMIVTISEITRNSVPTATILFALVGVSLLCDFTQVSSSVSRIINYFPTIRVSPITLQDYYLVRIFGHELNCLEFSPILYMVLTVFFSLICWESYSHYQVNGK